MKYKLLSLLNDIWYGKLRCLSSYLFYYLAQFFFFLSCYRSSRKLCSHSLRYGLIPSAIYLYKKIIDRFPYSIDDVSRGVTLEEVASRSIVVKWPVYDEERVEKGIIIITFTKTFSYYARNINMKLLQEHFWLVFEPSWSGYADPDIFFFYKLHKDIVISCSELEDRVLLNCFRETFVPVSFGAGDWVDYRRFSPVKVTKQYDSIYVANTRPIKRVKRYLDAIKNIIERGYSEYRALLVCAAWGGGEDLVKNLVKNYKLQKNVELKFSLSTDELIINISKSKVNVLLSYKEGSNRSLFESMLCDVPVICLSENIGVNKSYINEFTGYLIPDIFLEDTLILASQEFDRFNPRDWAINNISPKNSTSKLSKLLSDEIIGNNFSSLYVKTNNPEVSYFDYEEVSHKEYSKTILELFDLKSFENDISYKECLNKAKDKFNDMLKI